VQVVVYLPSEDGGGAPVKAVATAIPADAVLLPPENSR
jgi:hypothetical protein